MAPSSVRFVGTANSTSIETITSDNVNGYMRAGLATAVGVSHTGFNMDGNAGIDAVHLPSNHLFSMRAS